MSVQNDPLYSTGGDLGGVMEQSDSPVRVEVATVASSHQVSIGKGTATAGTATLTGRPAGMDGFEAVLDADGVAIVYDAAGSDAQVTYTDIDGRMIEFKWTLLGGNGTFLYNFSGVNR